MMLSPIGPMKGFLPNGGQEAAFLSDPDAVSKRRPDNSVSNARKRAMMLPVMSDAHKELLKDRQALEQAARAGHVDQVRTLIETKSHNGALLQVPDRKLPYTPLHFAVFYGHVDVVQLLLESNVNPDIRTLSGKSPLQWALDRGCTSSRLIELLLEHKASLTEPNNVGLTPLHAAVTAGSSALVSAILRTGNANVNERAGSDHEYMTALHLAATHNRVDIARVLLQHGADMRALTSRGYTALHKAALKNHVEVARVIFEALDRSVQEGRMTALEAADYVDMVDKVGRSALHCACFYAKKEVALALVLDGNADPYLEDNRGVTPMQLAKEKSKDMFSALVALLEENGTLRESV